ncbi:homeobox protein cut-like 1 isoform X2 [Alosa sapidissima]|nr:homeobox protein cut-like 1 isoform X2 [Alosa sapidissima]XP_041915972.1 homeobox protein cut-like 1 isoform X2 [Alosa sapidissima]
MLEKTQMKLQESFPSESTPHKALDSQLDGRLIGSACLDAQGIEETMVPTQHPPPSPSPSSPSPTDPSARRHKDQCQTERPDPGELFSLRLAKAEERIRSLQSALMSSQSEVLNLQRQYDEERTSRAKEAVNLMVANIEMVNQRVEAAPIGADIVRENVDRSCISAQNGSSPGERVGMERARLEMVIADRDREILRLREEVRRLQLMLHEAQESTTNQITQLEGQLARKIESIERLQVRLQSQQDYEQIKTELRIFRAMKEASLNGRISQLCSPLSERLTPMRPLKESSAISVTREMEVKRETQTPVGLPVAMDTPPPGSPRPAASSQGSSPRTLPLSPLSQSPDRPLLSPLIKPEPSPPGPLPEALYGPKGDLSFEGSRSPSRASHSSDGGMTGEPWEGGGGGGGGGGGSREEGEGELMETSEIALQVKEQLLRHNIGQRVFGHYVLGLSQGSVSEILARPKPWSKLTVKGKEPFLKMKHFLSNEQNILALRNIQVRQRGNITPRIRTPEMGSDEAIRNILEQAKKEIQREGEEISPLRTSGSGPSGRLSAGRGSSSGAGDSDDTIKAILEQARREMVAQQRHQALREMAVCHWGTSSSAAAATSSPPASTEPRPPSVKQEGASSSITVSSPQLLQQTPLSVISPKDFVQNIIRKVKSEIGDAGSYQGGHWSATSSTSHPLTSASPSLCSTTSSSSPFSNLAGQSSSWPDPWSRQPFGREQDQEDALSSQGEGGHMVKVKVEAEEEEQDEGAGHLSPCSAYVTRPPKPIVPPLTPDQYDSFMHQQVDTVLLTRQVKDRLAQKGICQRIFGEKVLGLSQGSVSDILSRPKPWSKLTQKGREPFIRMQLWMQGQLGQKLSPSPPNNDPSLEQDPALVNSSPSPDEERAGLLSEPGSLSLESSKENQQPPQQQGGHRGLGSLEVPHPTLSALDVQQLAILSPELDTLSITRRVKEVLNSNNLGQRLFGEMILGLTQGSVSDLLARPKPWSKLSLKGREPFVRMQLWLKDPQNIEKLREMKKMDSRGYLKRHHNLLSSGLDRDSPASASDMASYLESSHPGQAKKARVVLATQEKEALKRAYQLEPYPSQSTIERLASQLGLKISTVINWFHNYRSRMRRDFEEGELLKADTLKPLPGGDLKEMHQMHCSQSPSKGDHSLSMPVGLVTVKQEPWELREAEEQPSETDAHLTKYISMGVQFAGRLEMKEESLRNPSPRLCSRLNQEVRGECGETSASLPKPDRLPGIPPVSHASEAQTFSHSSKEDTEPEANAAAAASASSSPTHTLPPVSPLPSSTTPTPLTSEAAAEQITVQQSLVAGHSTQQRSAKKANLDNIIHRLERAANREEMLEWEF